MRKLIQIKSLLERHGIRPKALKDEDVGASANLVTRYLRQIWSNDQINEDEISLALYGPLANRSSDKYKKLKSRVFDELAEAVITLDESALTLNNDQRAYYKAYRELIVGKILEGRGAPAAARYYYKRAKRQARKFDLNMVGMEASSGLRYYASRFQRDSKEFNRHHADFMYFRASLLAEQDAVEKYSRIVLAYDTSPLASKRLTTLAKQYLQELENNYIVDELGPSYAQSYFLIKIMAQSGANYDMSSLPVIHQANNYFEQLGKPFPIQQSLFLFHELVIYTLTQDYAKGAKIIEKCFKLLDQGHTQYLKLLELSVQFHLHCGQFIRAVSMYNLGVDKMKEDYVMGSGHQRERWILFEVYLQLLIGEPNEIKRFAGKDKKGDFCYVHSCKSISNLSKEKDGRNIALIISEIIFLHKRNEFNRFELRVDSLKRYANRHLGNKENQRSRYFIAILDCLRMNDSHRPAFVKQSKKWISMIENTPLSGIKQNFEIEIVPYEQLYHHLVQQIST